MRYWNDNRKSCEHVEPREDWKESIEKWIDWMDAIGRTNDTLRTRWYQIVRFSKAVDKSITDVTEDDLIFYLAAWEPKADAEYAAASRSSTNGA